MALATQEDSAVVSYETSLRMLREHSWRYLLKGAEELSTALHKPSPYHEHCKYEA